MIRPSFIDNMGWEMATVYGAISDQILINLAKYFPYWKTSNVPKSAFEYQAVMLAQMGQVNRETIKIIRDGLKGANAALSNCLEQAIMEAVSKAEPDLLKAVQKGLLNPVGRPIVAPNQMRAFDFYYDQASQKLNLVNTVMLESTKQAYQATVSDIVARVNATQTALDIGAGETITGVSSWNQALRHSIDRMKQNGITGFIDHGGHRWSAEAYAAMDIRTTMANTARAAVWETNQDFGNDLYLVSYHNGARPKCYDWQNKVISSTDNARTVTDLDGNEIYVYAQSETTYGEAAGLFGINCKHYPQPFIPGVSVIYGQPQTPEENEKTYAESQQQRALEREIREQKRDLLMMKAQGAPDDEIRAQRARIRATDDKIDAFCEETGRARRQSREGVYTQRSFPDKDTYDVSTFERTQKEQIDKYFSGGGAQQGYTFGEMKQNEQDTFKTSKEYDDEISRLRQRRQELFDKDVYTAKDKEESDNLLKRIFDLEDKRDQLVFNGDAVIQNVVQNATTSPASVVKSTKGDIVRSSVGVGKGHRMSIGEAVKDANPNYKTGGGQYRVNCQRCVQTYELRRRGYNVEAMPKPLRNNTVSWGSEIFGDYGKSKLSASGAYTLNITEQAVKDELAKAPNGARYSIYIQWKSGSAHVFVAEKARGVIRYVDPQSGNMDVSDYFKDGKAGKFGFFRMDDKPLTKDGSLISETVRKGR